MPRLNEETGLKECSMCHEHKPAEMFSKSKYSSDGYISQCKKCISELKSNANFQPSNISEYTCIRCCILQPISNFHLNRRNANGYSHYCKSCANKESNKYRKIPEAYLTISEKQCSKCKEIRGVSDFHKYKLSKDGYKSECKYCSSEDAKNKELIIDRSLETKVCTKCKLEQDVSEFSYRKGTLSGYKSSCKTCDSTFTKIKYQDRATKDKMNEYRRNKIKEDDVFRLNLRIRNNIRNAVTTKLNRKSRKTADVLGISIKEFKDYLVSNLSIDNEVNIHDLLDTHDLDHIIPMSLATNDNDVYALNHYTNFRLCDRVSNMSKSDKILHDLITSHFENYQDSPAYKFYLDKLKEDNTND